MKEEVTLEKKFKKFNVFSKDGQNQVVEAPRRMTLSEALDYFHALAVSGIE